MTCIVHYESFYTIYDTFPGIVYLEAPNMAQDKPDPQIEAFLRELKAQHPGSIDDREAVPQAPGSRIDLGGASPSIDLEGQVGKLSGQLKSQFGGKDEDGLDNESVLVLDDDSAPSAGTMGGKKVQQFLTREDIFGLAKLKATYMGDQQKEGYTLYGFRITASEFLKEPEDLGVATVAARNDIVEKVSWNMGVRQSQERPAVMPSAKLLYESSTNSFRCTETEKEQYKELFKYTIRSIGAAGIEASLPKEVINALNQIYSKI